MLGTADMGSAGHCQHLDYGPQSLADQGDSRAPAGRHSKNKGKERYGNGLGTGGPTPPREAPKAGENKTKAGEERRRRSVKPGGDGGPGLSLESSDL